MNQAHTTTVKQLLLTGISLFCLLLLAGCGSEEVQQAEVIRPVKYQRVAPGGSLQTRAYSGTAIAGTETRLSFKVGGTISKLPVKVGQEVEKGTLLATLDASDYQLEYEQADASVKNADAQEKQTKSNFERVRSLYENGSTSLSDYENAKASYQSAKANESAAKKARKLARAQLSYTRLVAPIQGKVSQLNAEINENVGSGQQVLVLSSEGDLEVNLGIPESYIANVNVQDAVDVAFSAIPGQTFKGVVSEVSYSINAQTSTYPVIIKLQGNTEVVRPGMAATVTFTKRQTAEENADRLLVPAQAVGQDEVGNYVFAITAHDNHYIVQRQAVTVGELTNGGFEITDGLVEGDLIAVAGLQMLLDSMKVRLYEN